jgi:hypothetical protein
MKTVTLRLPDSLVAEIAAESRTRGMSKSDVMRERLQAGSGNTKVDPLASIRDLIGAMDSGPPDLSARKKHYLRAWGYGRKHPPR